jgi:site-specific recombinase XerD
MNIATFLDYLLEHDRAERTIDGYRRDLVHFAAWFEQTTGQTSDSVRITPLDIREYRQFLKTIKRLKPASVNRKLAALKTYFGWARDVGLVAHNPTDGIKSVGQTETPQRWLSRAQAFALSRAATEAIQLAETKGLRPSTILAKRNAAILAVLLHGLRVSEVCDLELADVTLKPRGGFVIVRSGKGGRYREIPLNKDAREALQTWFEARPQNGSTMLFTSRNDDPVQPRDIQRMLDKLAHSASGLDPEQVTPHKLRHTFGKSLVDAGISLDRVAMLMGHRNLSTTAIYTTPSREDLTAAVEKIAWKD